MQARGTTDEAKSDLQRETDEERIERLTTYIKLHQYPPSEKDLYEYARYSSVISGTEPYVYSPGEEDELLKQWESDMTNKNKTDTHKDHEELIALTTNGIQTVSTSNQSIFNKRLKNNNDHLGNTTNAFDRMKDSILKIFN